MKLVIDHPHHSASSMPHRLSIIKLVADYVAKTNEVVNLNARSLRKFVDIESSSALEHCRSLLCAPMKVNEK